MMMINATSRLMRIHLDAQQVMESVTSRFNSPSCFYSRAINLPSDARPIGLYYDAYTLPPTVSVVLESQEFDEVPRGETIPVFHPLMATCNLLEDAAEQMRRTQPSREVTYQEVMDRGTLFCAFCGGTRQIESLCPNGCYAPAPDFKGATLTQEKAKPS